MLSVMVEQSVNDEIYILSFEAYVSVGDVFLPSKEQ